MPKTSAGILLYRFKEEDLEVLLVHPGGPFWEKKDIGAWSIPKGEIQDKEDLLDAAIRETEEEIGIEVSGNLTPLTPLKENNNKIIYAWAGQQDLDNSKIKSNTFELEWPPKSGIKNKFPEIDKANWFKLDDAKLKISKGQLPFITKLEHLVNP